MPGTSSGTVGRSCCELIGLTVSKLSHERRADLRVCEKHDASHAALDALNCFHSCCCDARAIHAREVQALRRPFPRQSARATAVTAATPTPRRKSLCSTAQCDAPCAPASSWAANLPSSHSRRAECTGQAWRVRGRDSQPTARIADRKKSA